VLDRLAIPYAIDQRGRASASQYVASVLTPWSGLIATVHDFAFFDLALREDGRFVPKETLEQAWRAPSGAGGQRLPHGLGWFVQTYNGERIVWQFGVGDGASSSLLITVPGRDLSLIMLANSDRLVRPFPLAAGDLTVSPFGRLFLSLFAR
jgi:CubicO group peptidase (beta-lactamase class C family)